MVWIGLDRSGWEDGNELADEYAKQGTVDNTMQNNLWPERTDDPWAWARQEVTSPGLDIGLARRKATVCAWGAGNLILWLTQVTFEKKGKKNHPALVSKEIGIASQSVEGQIGKKWALASSCK